MTLPPWDRGWLQLSPEGFERMVVDFLHDLEGNLAEFSVSHKEKLSGPDGEFELDAVTKFRVLGAEFIVVAECKHHSNPIKRELVQVLRDKVRSVSAQKGMLFSTAPFQSGAIEYARKQGIALIHFTPGGPIYETRGAGGPIGPSRTHDAYWVDLSTKGGLLYRYGSGSELSAFLFGPTPNDTKDA